MLKAIRYILAAICLAVSVGCLALWWRNFDYTEMIFVRVTPARSLFLFVELGNTAVMSRATAQRAAGTMSPMMSRASNPMPDSRRVSRLFLGSFAATSNGVAFPLWYPALVFALTGVGVLRFRRQFTLRSALVGMSAVAVLLGMVVAL